MLEHRAQINLLANNPVFPFAPLHSAMSAGHNDIVLLLLARGADVNVRVSLLLERGADAGARTDDGKLAEDLAATASSLT
jgi:ankyrin repeat protein